MYIPAHFEQTDREAAFDLIENNAFGLLVTHTGEMLDAVHLPFLADRTRGAQGSLRGHVARANPIWRHFEQDVLVVFQGPHAYLSPDWYESPGQVPTWNYAVAHVYGRPRVLDAEALQTLLEDLSLTHETPLAPKPVWRLSKLKPARRKALMDHIVGFELKIERIECKFKLSQNRVGTDIDGAVAALRDQGSEMTEGVADLMHRYRPGH